jgi:FkbM family methyltransferase
MSFVDVGANWGYFTLLAASLVGPGGRVFSLEPDPRLFATLEENVKRSKLSQVTVLKIAAADKACMLTLAGYNERDDNFGVSRVITKSNGQTSTFQVNADSLDRLLDRHELHSVDLMKMDIEGAEGFALAGLAKSLSEKRIRRLLLELHPQLLAEHGDTAANLMEQLQRFGYKPWTIDHSPSVTRRAAYKRSIDRGMLLRPLSSRESLDAWPHQLWLAPGTEL